LKIPITRIRQVAGTDKQGTNVLGLIRAAEQLEFSAKGVKGDVTAQVLSISEGAWYTQNRGEVWSGRLVVDESEGRDLAETTVYLQYV
ncbi:MAG: hypothetical protein LBC46_00580, partial [Treponema sp.]|nr:hypothetical protein [Treponema sp.]